jgi:hypothetical protein
MRTLVRWAARLYPATWRNRYAAEFDALLEDISPSFGDLCDVLGEVLRVRVTTAIDACLVVAPVSMMILRLPVLGSLTVHGLVIILVLLVAFSRATTMPMHVLAPLPPPTPEPPPLVTDARVFPNARSLYSSLPLRMPADGEVLPTYVSEGVGINFLSPPDIGAVYRQGNAEWRIWPGQALENFIVRRVLPVYPHSGTDFRGAVSVFVEYLILQDGSVKVLRTSGPALFSHAAQSAIKRWQYRPLEYENHSCEVVSRVEVRFDGEFALSGLSH